MSETTSAVQPRLVRMHPADNVAIVVNEGGLPAGTLLEGGLVLLDKVPQGHKVALVALAQGEVVRRYNVPIGHVFQDIAAGRWVHERLLQMPAARELQGLPMATVVAPVQAPLTGYTFEGYRNADGSVGTRNILAITTTELCAASRTSCCPCTRMWTTWWVWSTATAVAWPSTRPTPSFRSGPCATSA
jgi:galactarate dehydratase